MIITWLAENWVLLVALGSVIVGCFMTTRMFLRLPSDEQIKSIKEWLLYAVTQAEKELGGGTGKLKLRQVYDAFVTKFSWAAKLVPFNMFSMWVDEALIEMRRLLESNNDVKQYVEGDKQ